MESHCRGSGSTTPLSSSWPVRLSGEVIEPESTLSLNFVINGALEEAKWVVWAGSNWYHGNRDLQKKAFFLCVLESSGVSQNETS